MWKSIVITFYISGWEPWVEWLAHLNDSIYVLMYEKKLSKSLGEMLPRGGANNVRWADIVLRVCLSSLTASRQITNIHTLK